MNKTYARSESLFERSQRVIPGGVNSPVRAARSVGACPLFIARAEGSKIIDVDNQVYIDYVGSWGPMILGHAHPPSSRPFSGGCLSGNQLRGSHGGRSDPG